MVDDTPDDVVFELHNAALWGDHPFGYSILGTPETVASLGLPELRALHERAYRASNVIVAASGNVRHDQLLAVLKCAGWTRCPEAPRRRCTWHRRARPRPATARSSGTRSRCISCSAM